MKTVTTAYSGLTKFKNRFQGSSDEPLDPFISENCENEKERERERERSFICMTFNTKVLLKLSKTVTDRLKNI